MSELLYKEDSFKVIGICMEIHRSLGMGLKEVNYQDALEIDLIENNIFYKREEPFVVKYKDQVLGNRYIADFIIANTIVLEIKATTFIHESHLAQAMSYLAVTKLNLP